MFDKPNPSRDPDERQRRPFVEVSAFDDLGAWREDEVISILEYDRAYIVYGRAVN